MKLQENISLQPYNTFGLDVNAKYLLAFSSEAELQEILKHEVYKNNEHFVLGGGSNILFTKNFDGLVLKNNLKSY